MSCCLESRPFPEPAAGQSLAGRTLSPRTLDLPQTLPETSGAKSSAGGCSPGACLPCLPKLCFIYLFVWEAEQASDSAHGSGLGCIFSFFHYA